MNITKESPEWLADAQSAESGSRNKSTSLESEQLPSLRELVARLLAAHIETNDLLRQTITHTTLLIDAMAAQGEDEDGFMDTSKYLDETPRN